MGGLLLLRRVGSIAFAEWAPSSSAQPSPTNTGGKGVQQKLLLLLHCSLASPSPPIIAVAASVAIIAHQHCVASLQPCPSTASFSRVSPAAAAAKDAKGAAAATEEATPSATTCCLHDGASATECAASTAATPVSAHSAPTQRAEQLLVACLHTSCERTACSLAASLRLRACAFSLALACVSREGHAPIVSAPRAPEKIDDDDG